MDFLTVKYQNLNNKFVFMVLLVLSFFIRFPFFFRDYIDRDESTFILVAQSWVDGNLPYTELWDVKPPFVFLFFATVISIFGKSFIAIRAIGALLIALTAYFTYKIGVALSTKKIAFWSAMACVALQSMFGSIQGVMSEHISVVFLMPAIYLVIKNKHWLWLALAGLLMGVSIMVKLNMAYPVLLVGLYLIYYFVKNKEYKNGVFGVTLYGLGIITVILLTIVPYYLQGLQELWWKSVVIAPLDYAGARRYSIFRMMPTFLVVIGFLFYARKKKYLDFKNPSVQILLVSILGVLYSFFKGGRINGHYLILLYPILTILVGIAINKVSFFKKPTIHKMYLLLLLLLPVESYLEYYAVIKHKIERGSFYNGEGITVPKYLIRNNIDTEDILFLGYHIGYWPLGRNPPTKAATHPSNILKHEMFAAYGNPRENKMAELRYIIEDIRPNIIVTRLDRLIFNEKQVRANQYMDIALKERYKVLDTVDKAEIYQRLGQ